MHLSSFNYIITFKIYIKTCQKNFYKKLKEFNYEKKTKDPHLANKELDTLLVKIC